MEEQNVKAAVAYLIRATDERPEECGQLFDKLLKHEQDAKSISENLNQAHKAIEELTKHMDMKIGAIESLADAIGSLLPEDKIEGWIEAFENLENEQAAKE